MAENLVVLKPGDDRAQKIAKAISSKTANDILTLLQDGGYTSSQIAEKLSLPITTIQYHMENLLDVEMLEVIEKRWSRKGREVKVYGLRDQLVIVAPQATDIRSLLLKYASLFCCLVAASIVAFAVASLLPGADVMPQNFVEKTAAPSEDRLLGAAATSEPDAASPINPYLSLILSFFVGGVAVLTALILYELLVRRRAIRGSA